MSAMLWKQPFATVPSAARTRRSALRTWCVKSPWRRKPCVWARTQRFPSLWRTNAAPLAPSPSTVRCQPCTTLESARAWWRRTRHALSSRLVNVSKWYRNHYLNMDNKLLSYLIFPLKPRYWSGPCDMRIISVIWWTTHPCCWLSLDGSLRPSKSWPSALTSECAHRILLLV